MATTKSAGKKPAAKKSTGASMKAMERGETSKVKAGAEGMKAQNVKAARAAVSKKELPPRKP